MRRRILTLPLVLLALAPLPSFAAGDGKTTPVIPKSSGHPLKELWSGSYYSPPELRKLQDSDSDNPAMKLFDEGEALWKKAEGREKKSCSSCHGEAATSMKGTATRFPAFFKLTKKPVNIESRINLCRTKFMRARALPANSKALNALSIYVKRQSKGMAMSVAGDGPLKPFVQKGKDYFTTRRGQLDMSCAACHDKYAAQRYRANKITQGHGNGFPAYSLSAKKTRSLLKQINQCLARIRAKPLKNGSDQATNLELYLAWRANGLKVETPAVRE